MTLPAPPQKKTLKNKSVSKSANVWQCLETFLVVTIEEERTSLQWVEARNVTEHSTVYSKKYHPQISKLLKLKNLAQMKH